MMMRRTLLLLATLLGALPMAAQVAPPKPAQLLGSVVRTGAETPLRDVAVAISDLGLTARTDSLGRFRITGIPPGTHLVTVQKIGFIPGRLFVAFAAADSLDTDIQLAESPSAAQPLEKVTVEAASPLGWGLEEFEARRAKGIGRFITRAEIEANAGRQLPEWLAQINGPSIQRSNKNGRAWAYTSRGIQSIMLNGQSKLSGDDLMSGASVGNCYTAVIVDGIEVYSGADHQPLFDLNSVNASKLAGIEFYPGGASMPARYAGLRVACGLLILWTR